MCYYSALSVRTREAVEGENLELREIPSEYGIRGFVSPQEPGTAVCLLNKSRLLLRDLPKTFQRRYGVGPELEVIFRDGRRRQTWDKVIFKAELPISSVILLKDIPVGIRADVLPKAKVKFAKPRDITDPVQAYAE